MSQMEQQMQQGRGVPGMGIPGTGIPGMGLWLQQPPMGGLDFSTLLNPPSTTVPAGTTVPTIPVGLSGTTGTTGVIGNPTTTARPPAAVEHPAVRFASQLEQLEAMGFNDRDLNIRMLQQTNGNVNIVVERLLSGN